MSAATPLPDDTTIHAPSLKECFQHTDLRWRLGAIPDDWACRGVFFNMLDDRSRELGSDAQRAYRDFFQIYRFSPLRFYPVKDYLTRIVIVSQIRYGAENIYGGIYEIQKSAFPTWRSTLIGRAAFAVLAGGLHTVMGGVQRAYDGKTATNHTELKVTHDDPQTIRAAFRNEPLYIEHAMLGALTGVADLCGAKVDIRAEMIDPFNGDIVIHIR